MSAPGVGRVLPLPSAVPKVRRNAFTRWLGNTILALGGWRMEGAFPDVAKLVLIGAPHSSNWDGVWGFAAKMALGLDVRIFGKKELFWWPLGPVLRGLGVIPLDRQASSGLVEQLSDRIRGERAFWLGVAPEGTRSRVDRWKTGFWKIAKGAGVPILPTYFHYGRRVIGIGPLFEPGDDMAADIARLQGWYREVSKGRNHDVL